jgi:hypothetical protein
VRLEAEPADDGGKLKVSEGSVFDVDDVNLTAWWQVGFPAPCPESLDASLRFAFYRRGAPLAVARYETFCGGDVELDIGGRLEPELSPGVEFLSQVSAAIHTKLTTAVREPSRTPRRR